MLPSLLSVGAFQISSFGLFLALAFLSAVFIIWRLSQAYDTPEEKIIDLIILTFFGGIIGARIYFVLWHLEAFGDLGKIILINHYPGLSFWGGLFGGLVVFWILVYRFKLNFWKIADFAAVGLLFGLAVGDLGCFLGGCGYGMVSNLPIAAPVVGLLGKRFPVSFLEALVLLAVFPSLWKQSLRFHFAGKIAALFLIILGVVKFVTEFFRGDSKPIFQFSFISAGHLLSLIILIFGLTVLYLRSKHHLKADLKFLKELFTSAKRRQVVLSTLQKSWYNQKITWKIRFQLVALGLKNSPKNLKRRFNVKSTPKNFR